MTKKNLLAALIMLFLFTASVTAQQAVTFSFASDDNHAGANFYYDPATPMNIFGSRVPVDLMVDRNDNSTGGIVTIQSYMYFRGEIIQYMNIPFAGNFLHIWKLHGYMRFYHNDNPLLPVLNINFNNAVLTSYSPTNTSAGETMTLQVSESVDPNIIMSPMNLLPGIGVTPATLAAFEDFALTFTSIKTGAGTILIPLAGGGAFNDAWKAEGSFSASGCN